MKFKRIDDLDEKFSSDLSREEHHKKHVVKERQFPKISPDEYEHIGDTLAKTPVDHKKILGYETTPSEKDQRTRYAKYNVETGDFVVYGWRNAEPILITVHRKTLREYNTDKAVKYMGEIPEGK